jgi:CheY-like chemotaxis protein
MDTAEPYLVLIAEDESSIAAVLATFVEELGYVPMVAPHGAAALALARERWPALVLTDQMMPLLSGSRLVAALRAEAAAQGRSMPPIILMSAGSLRIAKQAGADVVLPKPFDLEQVAALLEQFLGRPR